MSECMAFPDTVEEFMEQYKVVDTERVYTNGTEFVPIYRMKQWFDHLSSVQPEHDENDLNFMQPHKRIPVQLVVSGDCISRRTAIDALQSYDYSDGYADGYKQGQKDAQPERKTGRWIDRNDNVATCSVCDSRWGLYRLLNYCPNCGAKMEGEADERPM